MPQVARYQFVIVSYDLLPKVVPDAQRSPFRVVVLDESHYIKSSGVRISVHWVHRLLPVVHQPDP